MLYTILLFVSYLVLLGVIIQKGRKGMIYFILFNFFIDLIIGFVESGAFFGALKHIGNFALIIFMFFYFKPKVNSSSRGGFVLMLFIVYVTLLLLFTNSGFYDSFLTYLPFISALLMYFVGHRSIKSLDEVKELIKPLVIILLVFPIYTLLAQIFKFGQSYSEEFSVGFLTTSRIYIISLVIVLIPFLLDIGIFKKSWLKTPIIVLTALNFLILVINLRRTSIILVVIGLMIYTTIRRKISFGMVALIFLSLSVGYVFLGDLFIEQLEARERITTVDSYEEEGRLIELISFSDFFDNHMNEEQKLFGYNFFKSEEFGLKYFGRPRTIHGDLLTIFFSTGLIGIILFLIFLIKLFTIRSRYRIRHFSKRASYAPALKIIYWVLLIQFLFVLIPGRFIGQFTYAGLLMLLLGAFSNFILSSPNKYESTNSQ